MNSDRVRVRVRACVGGGYLYVDEGRNFILFLFFWIFEAQTVKKC
jgi:hypothetical protein